MTERQQDQDWIERTRELYQARSNRAIAQAIPGASVDLGALVTAEADRLDALGRDARECAV